MQILLQVAAGAGLGAVAGLLAGFVAAVLTLQARRWRNGRLMARGEPGWKDCALPLAVIQLSAVVSLLIAASLAPWLTLSTAVLIGASIPSGLLALVGIGNAVWQTYQ